MSRIVNLDGTFNTRDFGGWFTKKNTIVKEGVFYRSDALHKLSTKDAQELKKLKIKSIVDFRSKEEQMVAPNIKIDGITYYSLSPNADIAALGSGNIVDDAEKIDKLLQTVETERGCKELLQKANEMAEQMRDLVNNPYANKQYEKFLNLLLDEENVPILHHCKGGKDRTGLASMLVLLALDVDVEYAIEDYLMSDICMKGRNELRMKEYQAYTQNAFVLDYLHGLMQTKLLYIEAALDEMLKLAGSYSNYLEKYLHFSKEKCEQLQRMYTIPGEI